MGDSLVTLSNKNTVARIPAGGTFTSDWMTLSVPSNAPDRVVILLSIANIYHHHEKTDQVAMTGLSTTHEVSLLETSYYGEITGITPETSNGDQDIVIEGRAVERSSGDPMANVPLNLVITVRGFEREYEMYTDQDGFFYYTSHPLFGESGVYDVRAMHPVLMDRPVHKRFVISRLNLTPSIINLNLPRNYTKTIAVRAAAGDGTTATNLRLVYAAEDQPDGVLPKGVHLTTGTPIENLASGKTASLPFTIRGDNFAENGSLVLKAVSDESETDAWATITINTHFSEATPVLHFSPSFVETGAARDDTATETVTLKNKGLATMHDMYVALRAPDDGEAPPWVYLNGVRDLDSIAVGEEKEVRVSFSPTASVAEGEYSFYIR